MGKSTPLRAKPRIPGRVIVSDEAFDGLVQQTRQSEEVPSLVSSIAPAPASLPMALIDPDPDQPRKTFDEAALAELAETIKERGVRQPISVRPNPRLPGRYIINSGERRYRAVKHLGLEMIPAVVHADSTPEDQVIENIQREALSPLEIADYLHRKIQEGLKKGVIAARIGKSPAFVSRHLALIGLPTVLQEAFASGRCSDVSVIYDLRNLHEEAPEKTEVWLRDATTELTRNSVGVLRRYILEGQGGAEATAVVVPTSPTNATETPVGPARPAASKSVQLDTARGETMSKLLGLSVQVYVEPKQIRIRYSAPEDLDRIEQMLVLGTT